VASILGADGFGPLIVAEGRIMTDPLGQAGLTGRRRLLDILPGFKGYREREERRQADKLLRDHLVTAIDAERSKLQRSEADLSRAGKIVLVGKLDRSLGQLTKWRDKLHYADYGYTGWLEKPAFDELELDKMYQYDLSLQDAIKSLQEKVAAMTSADDAGFDAALAALDAAIAELGGKIEGRGEAIAGLAPSQ
jgi:hypothetical protein